MTIIYDYRRISLEIISLPFVFACHVWFYPKSLSHPASESWRRQCQGYTLFHDVGLKVDEPSVGHSNNFCATFTPRISCRSIVAQRLYGWVEVQSLHLKSHLVTEMASSGFVSAIARSLCFGHPIYFWDFHYSTIPAYLRDAPDCNCLSQYCLSPSSHNLIPPVPILLYPDPFSGRPVWYLFYFPFIVRFMCPLLLLHCGVVSLGL